MMENKEKNIHLEYFFKEFIETEPKKGGSRKKSPDFVCDLLIHEPKSIEEARLGILFILGKIVNIPSNKYKNFDFLLNLLISVIKREFYSNPERSSEKALEASLHNANLYLDDFADKGNTEWIGNLHVVCGVLANNSLYLAKTGDLSIKLLRDETVSHIDKKFPTSEKLSPLNTFSNIVSGRLLDKDKILICNKEVLDKIKLVKLRKLSSTSCGFIINFLKKNLEEDEVDYPLLCLTIEARAKEGFWEKEETEIQSIFQKEILIEKLNNKTRTVYIDKAKALILKCFIVLKFIFKFLLLAIKYLGILLFKIYRLIYPLFRKITQSSFYNRLSPIFQKRKKVFIKLFSQVTKRIKNWFLKQKNNIIELYKRNKPAFWVASLLVALILVFCFSVVNQIIYSSRINKFNYEFIKLQAIQKKAELSLIYQDKEKAKLIFEKSQNLFDNISSFVQKNSLDKNLEVKKRLASLIEAQQQLRDSFSNIKRPKLEKVFSFKDSGFIVKPIGIEKINESLYFYELESGILYRFNLNNTSQEKNIDKKLILVFISAKDELRKMTALEDKNLVLIGQSGKVYLYNPESNEHTVYPVNPEIIIEETRDIDSFSSSFYLLIPEKGEIMKYSLVNSSQEAIVQGKNWLAEEPFKDFSKAKSIAIDGSIYLLTDDKIVKYYKGKKQKEVSIILEKSLGKENKLFTKSGFQYLYISDPDNNRLLILDKEGRIVYQFVNEEFSNLLDFWVTKDEKTIYVLCNTEVYKLNI